MSSSQVRSLVSELTCLLLVVHSRAANQEPGQLFDTTLDHGHNLYVSIPVGLSAAPLAVDVLNAVLVPLPPTLPDGPSTFVWTNKAEPYKSY